MESPSFGGQGRGRGRGFGRGRGGFGGGDFGGGDEGGRGRGQRFGGSSPPRARSPVQQIRRNRFDEDAPKPETGPPQGFRGRGRPPFRGGGNFAPVAPRGRGFRPEITSGQSVFNTSSGAPSLFPPPAPERIYRNIADAPRPPLGNLVMQNSQQQTSTLPTFVLQNQNQNNMNLTGPNYRFDDSQDQASGFANAGAGPGSNPWIAKNNNSDNSSKNNSGSSLLKPQYLMEGSKNPNQSPLLSAKAPPPPLLGRCTPNQSQKQEANFVPHNSANNFNGPPNNLSNPRNNFNDPANNLNNPTNNFNNPTNSFSNPANSFNNPANNFNNPINNFNNPANNFSSSSPLFLPAFLNQFQPPPSNPFIPNFNSNQIPPLSTDNNNSFSNFVPSNATFNLQQFQQQMPFLNNPPVITSNTSDNLSNQPGAGSGSMPKPLKSLLEIDANDVTREKIDTSENSQSGLAQKSLFSTGNELIPNSVVNPVGSFFVKPPMRYDGQVGNASLNAPHPLLSKLPNIEPRTVLNSNSKQSISANTKSAPEQNRVKPQPPPPPKIGIPTSTIVPQLKQEPLQPPSPPAKEALSKLSPDDSHQTSNNPTKNVADDDSSISYEAEFLELTAKFDLVTNVAPKFKLADSGQKLFAFHVEFGRDNIMTMAEGQFLPNLNKARDHAYCIAYKKALAAYGPDSDLQRKSFRTDFKPPQPQPSNSSRFFRSQESWPNNSSKAAEEDTDDRPLKSLPVRPSPPSNKPKPLLSQPPMNPKPPLLQDSIPNQHPLNTKSGSEPGSNVIRPPEAQRHESKPPDPIQNANAEQRFKDYMDILHMQCWLKAKEKPDRGRQVVAFEIEVQSYDKRFHKFYYGEYFELDSSAKESAFEAACSGLEKGFSRELGQVKNKSVVPNQRAFMDLRSILGLTVRCQPEIKRDATGQTTYAFNIEFCRGGEWETVYGEFSTDEKQSMEKAYELATWRVKYIYGPELEIDFKNLEQNHDNDNDDRHIEPPRNQNQSFIPKNVSQRQEEVDWQPPVKRVFNPHYSAPTNSNQNQDYPSQSLVNSTMGKNRAYIPPTIKSQPQNQSHLHTPVYQHRDPPPTPSHAQDSDGRSRTPIEDIRTGSNNVHEELFKEYTSVLNLEYMLRKIPKFEGGHKIFAYEVKFKAKIGQMAIHQSMGEYFRDEGMAKENAFKYACEYLSSKFGTAFDNMQEANRFF